MSWGCGSVDGFVPLAELNIRCQHVPLIAICELIPEPQVHKQLKGR